MIVKVNTGRLREHDVLKVMGATIRIEGKPMITVGPAGRTVWMWPNQSIVSGRMAPYPGATTWTIVGDTLTFWQVKR